jgi:hypothetical protein
MTLVLAILAVVYIALRLRAERSSICRPGCGRARIIPDGDLCLEYSDEELESWGLSREQMRAAELRHYEDCAHDNNDPDDRRMMRLLRPPYQFPPMARVTHRVRRPVRHASRSRRAPRRARPSRRARPAPRASADPEPVPGRRGPRDLLQEGGAR